MQKKGTIIILAVAIILGTVTASVIYYWLQGVRQDVEANLRDVVVATAPIKPRTMILPQMVAIDKVPKKKVAQGAATRVEDVVGKVTLDGYREKDQVWMNDLVAKDKMPTLSYAIPDGKRAVTIKVDEISGVGLAIHPGDHVDILATYRDPITGQQLTQIILQRMEVLAIDEAQTDIAKGSKGASKSVTLVASPDEAQKLTVTAAEGALRMMLRPEDDKSVVNLEPTTLRGLIKPQMVDADSVTNQAITAKMSIGEKEPPKVKVIRGSEPPKDVFVGE